MSGPVINLPTKHQNLGIEGVAVNGGYRIQSSTGWAICYIDALTPEGRADQIARAIREARDAGYQHALAHVRSTLGIQ